MTQRLPSLCEILGSVFSDLLHAGAGAVFILKIKEPG